MSHRERTGFRFVPDDVLFFRDGRPSTRGDDHHLRSLFPPHPSTLYGALRTRRLRDAGIEPADLRRQGESLWQTLEAGLRDELGEWGGFGSLELRGPWLVRCNEVLLPLPADVAVVAETARKRDVRDDLEPALPRVTRVARFLQAGSAPEPAGRHSHELGLLFPYEHHADGWRPWSGDSEPRHSSGWYLNGDGLDAWADGRAPEPDHLVHQDALWVEEPRVGIGLESDDRKAKDGLLYTFGFIRLRPGVAIGFDVAGSALVPGRRVSLGGEGRTGWLENGPALPVAPAGQASALRIAFATPTFSHAGAAMPAGGTTADLDLSIRAACVPGYSLVGGWDIAKAAPKPLRRALAAGSVLALTSAGGPLPLSTFHGSNLSDYADEHLALQGFGLVLAGLEPQLEETI